METNDKDRMLKDYFSVYKQELADNGFTQRLMRSLPEHADRSWIVWIFAAIGATISLYLGINSGLIEQIMLLFKHVSIYYILGGVFCFPFVGTIGFYLTQNKNYQVI